MRCRSGVSRLLTTPIRPQQLGKSKTAVMAVYNLQKHGHVEVARLLQEAPAVGVDRMRAVHLDPAYPFGFVEFTDADALAAAIALLHERELGGAKVVAERELAATPGWDPRVPRGQQCETIVVRNVPFASTADTIREWLVRDCSLRAPAEVTLRRNHYGRFMGLVFVRFVTVEDAVLAFHAVNNMEMGGRKVTVEFKRPQPPTGGRGRSGNRPRSRTMLLARTPPGAPPPGALRPRSSSFDTRLRGRRSGPRYVVPRQGHNTGGRNFLNGSSPWSSGPGLSYGASSARACDGGVRHNEVHRDPQHHHSVRASRPSPGPSVDEVLEPRVVAVRQPHGPCGDVRVFHGTARSVEIGDSGTLRNK